MTDIINYKSVAIQDLMDNIERYKYNPSGIQRTILDYLDEVTNGEVDIVDPTNPFVFLLEASSVNTAVAMNENLINLRKQYPSLAQTDEELYMHLSDKDFLDRFSLPAETDFTVVVQVNDLMNKMVYDTTNKHYKATIARDTEFKIDGLTFTLQYPIDIKKFDNGLVQISYNAEIDSPLQILTSNIIDYVVRKDKSQVDWLFFKVPVKQFVIKTAYYPIQLSSIFSYDIPYTDRYYFIRVYYKNNNSNNQWLEMMTTHTDQVFDPFNPTVVVKVMSKYVSIFIPSVYLNAGLISGDIRVDLYTTKGQITVNLSNYKFASFETNLRAINEPRDVTEFTNAMSNLSFYSFCNNIVSGGTNGVDFKTLRERVIFNSIGDRQLPITNIQLESYVNNRGFDLIRNVDVTTNRIFLATQKLPKPINTKLLTPANIGISPVVINASMLRLLSGVVDNGVRMTILSDNLYLSDNGVIEILSEDQIEAIKSMAKSSMVDFINNKQYLYCPFYYVLDSSQSEFEVRVYNLDYPVASNLSFMSQNESLQLSVNTDSYSLEKVLSGYSLTLTTKSGTFYKALGDNLVNAQIAYYPHGENNLAYINGTLVDKTSTGERVYNFMIFTKHDITSDDLLCVTNAKMFANENLTTWCNLNVKFHILYTTTSITDGYTPNNESSLIGDFILPENSAMVTYETLDLKLGSPLKNLWVRSRTFATGLEYARYEFDVPLLYDQDIYEIDPLTDSILTVTDDGNITYNKTHSLGEPVLNSDGYPVYKYRRGDAILDNDMKPLVISTIDATREIDMLFIDGRYMFTTDLTFIDYRKEIATILDTWITRDLKSIQDLLLEQTKIFFYPKTTLGYVTVYPDNITDERVQAEQSLIVNLYVKNDVYIDPSIRQQLTDRTITVLDKFISETVVNITEITIALKQVYGDTVTSFTLSNLGGADNNYNVITVASEHNRLCLKKLLHIQQDGTIIVKEDVAVSFFNIEPPMTT